MKPLTESQDCKEEMVGNPPCKRKKVEVLVERCDNQTDEIIGKSLNVGSERVAEIHATDPVVFCDCLKWKYNDTHKKWDIISLALYTSW